MARAGRSKVGCDDAPAVDASSESCDELAACWLQPPKGGGAGAADAHSCAGLICILRSVAPVALLAAMMEAFMMLEVHIYAPYLYTRVRCCTGPRDALPAEWDVVDPVDVQTLLEGAGALGIKVNVTRGAVAACDVPHFPLASEMWSFSSACPNKAYVEAAAQDTMAYMKPLQKLFALVVLPMGGALSDSVGRMPVLTMYSLGLLLACMLTAWDAASPSEHSDLVVFIAGCLFGLSFQPKDAIISSAVADLLGHDEAHKAQAFLALRTLSELFALVCDVLVYWYLKEHNSNYVSAWVSVAALALSTAVAAWLAVPETLPEGMKSKPQLSAMNPFAAQLSAMGLIARDKVLIAQTVVMFVFYVFFMGFISMRNSYLASVGFALEDSMLPEILGTLSAMVFSAGILPLVPKLGMWTMSTVGLVLFAASYAFVGPFTVFVSLAGAYPYSILCVCALVVTLPAFQTIVSQRVGKEEQGKGQAAVYAIGTLGAVVGVPYYNKVLFKPEGTLMQKAAPALASMILAAACAAGSIVVAAMARADPAPAAADDGSSGTDEEDIDERDSVGLQGKE